MNICLLKEMKIGVMDVAIKWFLSKPIFLPKLESFHKHPLEIDLTQACIGEVNTILRGGDTNWPIIYGIGVNTKTGEIFPGELCISRCT